MQLEELTIILRHKACDVNYGSADVSNAVERRKVTVSLQNMKVHRFFSLDLPFLSN